PRRTLPPPDPLVSSPPPPPSRSTPLPARQPFLPDLAAPTRSAAQAGRAPTSPDPHLLTHHMVSWEGVHELRSSPLHRLRPPVQAGRPHIAGSELLPRRPPRAFRRRSASSSLLRHLWPPRARHPHRVVNLRCSGLNARKRFT
uniref:Uncharacterized protein n=3 Tax=Aegilops tauschii subsp. strangulata TaxID=200361 RepID=A0A453I4F6_AEGTS